MKSNRGHLDVRTFALVVAGCAIMWAGAGFVCLFFGQADLSAGTVLSALRAGESGAARDIVLFQRLPRVILALLAGGGLAVAGAVFQALLRNPLATPHTLGVSAGGAFAAIAAISFSVTTPQWGPVGPLQFYGMIGAFVNMGIIYLLATKQHHFSTFKLLLAGVTLALISSALIMFVRYVSAPHKLVVVDRWLMGGLDVQGYRSLAAILPFFGPAVVLLLSRANALNLISFGEELAAGRGVNLKGLQTEIFVAGSVLTAAVVSVAGPVGFVGLIVPHAFRIALGPDHRKLLFASFFGGGALLVIADTFARTAFAPSELPVGVLTAMMGGPFFLVLLVRRGK